MQFRMTTQTVRTGIFSVFLCSLSRAVLMVMPVWSTVTNSNKYSWIFSFHDCSTTTRSKIAQYTSNRYPKILQRSLCKQQALIRIKKLYNTILLKEFDSFDQMRLIFNHLQPKSLISKLPFSIKTNAFS